MPPTFTNFSYSTFLGARAANVYAWFLKSLHLRGDVAECGVFSGETSRELTRYLEEAGSRKTLHMFDSFDGLPALFTTEEKTLAAGDELRRGHFFCTQTDVMRRMAELSQYKIHKGLFAHTFADFEEDLCFIHADADLYQSTVEIIHLADRCLVSGGNIVFDDYCNPYFPGIKLAVERYLSSEKYIINPSAESIQCFVTKR